MNSSNKLDHQAGMESDGSTHHPKAIIASAEVTSPNNRGDVKEQPTDMNRPGIGETRRMPGLVDELDRTNVPSEAITLKPHSGRHARAKGVTLKRSNGHGGVFVLGYGPLARMIMSELGNGANGRYELVGFTEDLTDGNSQNLSTDRLELMRELVSSGRVECIVVAQSERRGKLPVDDLLAFKTNGIRVEDGVKFYEKLTGRIALTELKPSSLIFNDGFRQFRFLMMSKRVIDIAVSCLLLILSAPVMAVLSVAIKLDSPGPVLFRQARIGQYGNLFQLLKFRSMCWEPNGTGDSRWVLKTDARLTRCGRIIRKLRLDELPQLWNVLKGDMSFVGPRPDVPELFKTLEAEVPFYDLRTVVKPGITGWAQVRYHYVSSVEDGMERHEYDLYYIKNMSLLVDLKIIRETIRTSLFAKGSR